MTGSSPHHLDDGGRAANVVVDRDQLRLLVNALNEVCNGIDIDAVEFPTRLGVDLPMAQRLLAELSDLYDDWPRPA